jgi:murein endopeptidase
MEQEQKNSSAPKKAEVVDRQSIQKEIVETFKEMSNAYAKVSEEKPPWERILIYSSMKKQICEMAKTRNSTESEMAMFLINEGLSKLEKEKEEADKAFLDA